VAGLASLGMTTNDFFYRDCTTSSPRQCGAYQLGYQVGALPTGVRKAEAQLSPVWL